MELYKPIKSDKVIEPECTILGNTLSQDVAELKRKVAEHDRRIAALERERRV